ncbi:MAG: hypothetical protein [Podoviridae sp. ctcf755]|nr:MAG: hypothetical protein [Podoviridae sp. ctcf755]
MKKVILKKERLTSNNIDFTCYLTEEKEEYSFVSWEQALNKYNELVESCKNEAKNNSQDKKWLYKKSHYYDVLIVDEDGEAYGQKIMSDGTIIK